MNAASIAYLVGAIVALFLQYFAVRRVRHHHAGHIFNLWYLFGLSLVIVSCLFAYIYMNVVNHGRPELQGWLGDVVVFLFDSALDIRGELNIVAGVSAFLLVPQFVAYLASGLYGCAQLPSALKWIDGFIAWSLIKFFNILAGVMAAQAIFATYGHPYRAPGDIPSRLFYASLFLSVSFTIFVFYSSRENLLQALDRLGLRDGLNKIHGFMTRCVNRQTDQSTQDSVEDMIFDVLSQWVLERFVKLIARKIKRSDQLQGA